MTIDYSLFTNVFLYLEDYYNKGITPEEAREIINTTRDMNGTLLNAQPTGFNNNWSFMTRSEDIEWTISKIEYQLKQKCKQKI